MHECMSARPSSAGLSPTARIEFDSSQRLVERVLEVPTEENGLRITRFVLEGSRIASAERSPLKSMPCA